MLGWKKNRINTIPEINKLIGFFKLNYLNFFKRRKIINISIKKIAGDAKLYINRWYAIEPN